MKRWFVLGLMSLSWAVFAQSTPAKKELVAKILQLQQPGIESVARALAERPALILLQQAGNVMQTRIPPDKRGPIAKDIEAELKKYVDETVPMMRERAAKLAPAALGPLLEERFSEDELKQLIVIIESPVNRKYLQMDGEMQKLLSEKLVADTKGTMEPRIRALEQSMASRMGLPPAPAANAGSAPARPPARAASN